MTDRVRLGVDGAERPQDHVVWRVVHGRAQGSRCSRRIHRWGATQRDAGDRRPRRAVLWVSHFSVYDKMARCRALSVYGRPM